MKKIEQSQLDRPTPDILKLNQVLPGLMPDLSAYPKEEPIFIQVELAELLHQTDNETIIKLIKKGDEKNENK